MLGNSTLFQVDQRSGLNYSINATQSFIQNCLCFFSCTYISGLCASDNTCVDATLDSTFNRYTAEISHAVTYCWSASNYDTSTCSQTCTKSRTVSCLRGDGVSVTNLTKCGTPEPVSTMACQVCPEDENKTALEPAVVKTSYALSGIVFVFSLACMFWVYYYRSNPLVRFWQSPFLVLIAVGSIISSSTTVPLSLTDKDHSDNSLDIACGIAPWLYCTGFVFSYVAMLAKLWRIKQLLASAVHMKVIEVPLMRAFCWMFAVLAVDYIVLAVWTGIDPLHWQRNCTEKDDGVCTESEGSCRSGLAGWFIVAIIVFHVGLLVNASWQCYQIRHVPDELAEGRWISTAVVSSLQIHIICIPLAYVTDSADIVFLLIAIGLFINNTAILFCLFIPKFFTLWNAGSDSNFQKKSTKQTLNNLKDAIIAKAAEATNVKQKPSNNRAGNLTIGSNSNTNINSQQSKSKASLTPSRGDTKSWRGARLANSNSNAAVEMKSKEKDDDAVAIHVAAPDVNPLEEANEAVVAGGNSVQQLAFVKQDFSETAKSVSADSKQELMHSSNNAHMLSQSNVLSQSSGTLGASAHFKTDSLDLKRDSMAHVAHDQQTTDQVIHSPTGIVSDRTSDLMPVMVAQTSQGELAEDENNVI